MFYRIKQFFWAILARVDSDDIKFINRYLNSEDIKFFELLPTYEKKHSINVAKYVEENSIYIDDFVIRAALLHDIGKINSGLNPIFKGIIVILNAISEKMTRKLEFIKPIYVYYNHGSIGEGLYRDIDPKIAYIIGKHHDYSINDRIVKMIQEGDSKN